MGMFHTCGEAMTQDRISAISQAQELRSFDRVVLVLMGLAVIFASLGLGEAVYRILFFDFEGATDRFPIEMAFGLAFAWVTMKIGKRIYQSQLDTSARMIIVRNRNHKIRDAVDALMPFQHPACHQSIRVIREEVDRIDRALSDVS